MHSLLIQLLIAYIDREFSPEEYKQLLDEADKELGYVGMIPFYDIHNQISKERTVMHEKFGHPTTKYYHRTLVKEVLGKEAAQANEPRLPQGASFKDQNGVLVQQGATYTRAEYEEMARDQQSPEDETPVDWQPRSVSVKIV